MQTRPLSAIVLVAATVAPFVMAGPAPVKSTATEAAAPGQPAKAKLPAPPAGTRHVAVPRTAAATGAGAFVFKINIAHGHIGHVFIGCRADATDGVDRRIDDLAPPPGIGGVGYTFLVSPDRRYNLYRDMRAPGPTVQWLFYAQVGDKPVVLSWDPAAVPAGQDLYAGLWDGKAATVSAPKDCRETTSLTLSETGFCRFWSVRRPPAERPAGAAPR